jgi:hypothetical protein
MHSAIRLALVLDLTMERVVLQMGVGLAQGPCVEMLRSPDFGLYRMWLALPRDQVSWQSPST